jgi:hypothetical protein
MQQFPGIKFVGIVRRPARDDGNLMTLREPFGDWSRRFGGRGSVWRIVLVEKQDVHMGLAFARDEAFGEGLAFGELRFFLQDEISQDQDVHLRTAEAFERFVGTADDRLVVVE